MYKQGYKCLNKLVRIATERYIVSKRLEKNGMRDMRKCNYFEHTCILREREREGEGERERERKNNMYCSLHAIRDKDDIRLCFFVTQTDCSASYRNIGQLIYGSVLCGVYNEILRRLKA